MPAGTIRSGQAGGATGDYLTDLQNGYIQTKSPTTGPAGSINTIGVGDNLTDFAAYAPSLAQLIDVRNGTASAPDTTTGPLVKVSRTLGLQATQIPSGDGSDLAAALIAGNFVPSTTQVQGVGLYGWAITQSSYSGGPGNADACGVYGIGRSQASSTRVGIGAFFDGRAEGTSSLASGIQVVVENRTGTDQTVLPANGFSKTNGIWLTGNGTNQAGVGLELGNPFGIQFDVGIEFSSQVAGGKTGPTKTNDIRSDSTASTAIFLNGVYSAAAIAIAAGAGGVFIGATSPINASELLEVRAPNAAANPLVLFGSSGFTNTYRVRLQNGAGLGEWFVSTGVNAVLTGSAGGDTGMVASTAGKRFLIGGTTVTFSVTQGNAIGFFNTAEVTQQSAVGTATGYAAGATAATFHSDDTYTGNTGATAYTINGIVHALKVYGLLAA